MNTTKLTLSVPPKILRGAKAYSKKTRQPLSRLVSRYFAILASKAKIGDDTDEVAPGVRKVTGLAKSTRPEEDLLFEALSSKYK